jgi:hypothetical protein
MRGGATEVNETQKWATNKKTLRTTGLDNQGSGVLFAAWTRDLSFSTQLSDRLWDSSSLLSSEYQSFCPRSVKLYL